MTGNPTIDSLPVKPSGKDEELTEAKRRSEEMDEIEDHKQTFSSFPQEALRLLVYRAA